MSDRPLPIVPTETTRAALERVRLGALVVVAAARWCELPASRSRRDALLAAVAELERLVGLRDG